MSRRECLLHVLRVAGIDYGDGVTLDGVGVVPLIVVCHVVAFPSVDGGPAARQCTLYGVDGKEGITHVSLHILIRISMTVFLSHVAIEGAYLGDRALGVQVFILHLSCRR